MGLARSRYRSKVKGRRKRQKYSFRFFFGLTFIVSGLIMIVTSIVLSLIR